MKFYLSIPLAAVFLAVSACSTSPESVKVNSGTVQAHTFNFVTPRSGALQGTDDRAPVHRMIQDAITRNLASKGVTKASTGDITVAYLVVIGNNVSTESVSTYFGYSEESEKLELKAHDVYTGTGNRSYFESGTLLIDVIDSRSGKLLKRGYGTSPLLRNLAAGERSAKVQQVVNSILNDLRIAP